jgi:hypothetical protein
LFRGLLFMVVDTMRDVLSKRRFQLRGLHDGE